MVRLCVNIVHWIVEVVVIVIISISRCEYASFIIICLYYYIYQSRKKNGTHKTRNTPKKKRMERMLVDGFLFLFCIKRLKSCIDSPFFRCCFCCIFSKRAKNARIQWIWCLYSFSLVLLCCLFSSSTFFFSWIEKEKQEEVKLLQISVLCLCECYREGSDSVSEN